MADKRKRIRRGGVHSIKYLSKEQEGQLRDWLAVRAMRARWKKRMRAIDDQFIVEFMLDTGVRAEELVNVKIEDTPFYHRKEFLEVVGKGNVERSIWLPDETITMIERYIKERRKHAKPGSALIASERGYRRIVHRVRLNNKTETRDFTRVEYSAKLKTDSLRKRINRIGLRSGVADLHPHMFRHTFGVKTYGVSNDLRFTADQMGHADTRTTEIYANVRNEARRRQAKRLNSTIPRHFSYENMSKQDYSGIERHKGFNNKGL